MGIKNSLVFSARWVFSCLLPKCPALSDRHLALLIGSSVKNKDFLIIIIVLHNLLHSVPESSF